MPLLGDRSPKVRITVFAGEAEFCLGVVRFEERDVGDAVRDDLDLARRHVMHGAKEGVTLLAT